VFHDCRDLGNHIVDRGFRSLFTIRGLVVPHESLRGHVLAKCDWGCFRSNIVTRYDHRINMQNANPRRDFIIGFFGAIVLNALLAGLVFLVFLIMFLWFGEPLPGTSREPLEELMGLFALIMPPLVNIGGLIYFGITRRWIAIGAVSMYAVGILFVRLVFMRN
jgi:hypothetical protein